MNEFGFYDPYYDLTESEREEMGEWFDSVDARSELCQTIDPNQDVPM